MALLFWRSPPYLLLLILFSLLLPVHPWIKPVQAASPWPLFAATLEELGAEEVVFGGWILFRENSAEEMEQTREAWNKIAGVVVSLQAAPGGESLNLLSFRSTDWRSCLNFAGAAGGELKGWTVEAFLPGGPTDVDRLASFLRAQAQAGVHHVYTGDGHVNLAGYSALLPSGFQVMGTAVNLHLDLRYHRHRDCLRLQVGVPVLPSPLTPASISF